MGWRKTRPSRPYNRFDGSDDFQETVGSGLIYLRQGSPTSSTQNIMPVVSERSDCNFGSYDIPLRVDISQSIDSRAEIGGLENASE